MNIVLQTSEGKVIVRPDTTWERDNEDLFVPEFVDNLSYTPVLFARISKPGRSIAVEFARRYFDGLGYGVLLYPDELFDGSDAGLACASCMDHTSFLPFPLEPPATLSGRFELSCNAVSFSCGGITLSVIEDAIARVSRLVYLRIGDLVAIELQQRVPLCSRNDGTIEVTGTSAGRRTIDFRIVF